MVIVDTHDHASPYWFEPIELLLFQMSINKVEKATLVQFLGQTDNSYLIECARRFPGRFSPVVIVDTKREDAPETLRYWVKEGAEGLRLVGNMRSPGKDPLAIWRAAGKLGIPVTVWAPEEEYASDEFRNVLKAVPETKVIIEHMGYPGRAEQPPYDTYKKVLSLAKLPNAYTKVPGLSEVTDKTSPFRQPYPYANVPPYYKMAYDAFGPSRMMWGGDYPPVSHREGYGNGLKCLKEHLATFCSQEDMEWIFGKTALSLYPFKAGQPVMTA
ncbi:MAG: amidohydrolase [Chloroflexi bacterium]|nr:amidohydrolase [Chloroflexota bacterium]